MTRNMTALDTLPLDTTTLISLFDARSASRALRPEQRATLMRTAREVSYPEAGALLFAEGDRADGLYIVLEGELLVEQVGASGQVFAVASLGVGETVGESALAQDGRRTASVRVARPSRLLHLDIGRLSAEVDGDRAQLGPLFREIAQENLRRVEAGNREMVAALEREAAESRERLAMGQFIMWVVGGLCLYTLSLGLARSVSDNLLLASLATNAVIAMGAVGMYHLVKSSPYPRSTFGLIIHPGWRRELIEALGVSLALMAVATGFKWLLITQTTAYAALPVFDSPLFGARPLTGVWMSTAVVYALLAGVQELVARGTLQSLLGEFLSGPRRHLLAILLANLIFATNHAHLSMMFAALSFVPGLVWGLLYHRQRSLLGVAVSHALVGVYCIHVLGMGVMLRM